MTTAPKTPAQPAKPPAKAPPTPAAKARATKKRRQRRTEVEQALRDQRACDLRNQGWSLRRIALDLDESPDTVRIRCARVVSAIEEAGAESRAVLRHHELQLDAELIDRAMQKLDGEGITPTEHAQLTRAIVYVQNRRANYLGLDAARKLAVGEVTEEQILDELQRRDEQTRLRLMQGGQTG